MNFVNTHDSFNSLKVTLGHQRKTFDRVISSSLVLDASKLTVQVSNHSSIPEDLTVGTGKLVYGLHAYWPRYRQKCFCRGFIRLWSTYTTKNEGQRILTVVTDILKIYWKILSIGRYLSGKKTGNSSKTTWRVRFFRKLPRPLGRLPQIPHPWIYSLTILMPESIESFSYSKRSQPKILPILLILHTRLLVSKHVTSSYWKYPHRPYQCQREGLSAYLSQ